MPITNFSWHKETKELVGIRWLTDALLESKLKIQRDGVIASFGAGSGEKEKYLFDRLNRLNLNPKFYLFDRDAKGLLEENVINPSINTENFTYNLNSIEVLDSVKYLLERNIKADIIIDIKGPFWHMFAYKRLIALDGRREYFGKGKDGIKSILNAYIELLKDDNSYVIIDCYRKEYSNPATVRKWFFSGKKYFGEVSTHYLIEKVVKQSPQRCYFTTKSNGSLLQKQAGICCLQKEDLRKLLQTYTQGVN